MKISDILYLGGYEAASQIAGLMGDLSKEGDRRCPGDPNLRLVCHKVVCVAVVREQQEYNMAFCRQYPAQSLVTREFSEPPSQGKQTEGVYGE